MPYYRRFRVEGGTYFFTLVMHERRPIFRSSLGRRILREAIANTQHIRPFEQISIVLLPDHLHVLWHLPEDDKDYSTRLGGIKQCFTRAWLAGGGTEGTTTPARRRQGYRGVWQKRFYEHTIRCYRDFKLHLDYIHSNPVKHGLVESPGDWPWSSFQRYVQKGEYSPDWCGHIVLPGGMDIEPETW